jgi:hypothetical protein
MNAWAEQIKQAEWTQSEIGFKTSSLQGLARLAKFSIHQLPK